MHNRHRRGGMLGADIPRTYRGRNDDQLLAVRIRGIRKIVIDRRHCKPHDGQSIDHHLLARV